MKRLTEAFLLALLVSFVIALFTFIVIGISKDIDAKNERWKKKCDLIEFGYYHDKPKQAEYLNMAIDSRCPMFDNPPSGN